MNPKFVYFDLDDTLLNHRQAQREALHDIHDHYSLFKGIETERFFEVYHRVNGKQWDLYNVGKIDSDELQHNRFALTLDEFGLEDTRSDEIGRKYLQVYQNYWQWLDGAEAAFNLIRNEYDVGILTNGFTEIQEKKFKQFDLYNSADELVISEQVGVLKPQPGIFEYATELAGCRPGEILYIGDSFSSDVTGGANFGWNVVWFSDSNDPEKRKKADFVFNDYQQLLELLQIEG